MKNKLFYTVLFLTLSSSCFASGTGKGILYNFGKITSANDQQNYAYLSINPDRSYTTRSGAGPYKAVVNFAGDNDCTSDGVIAGFSIDNMTTDIKRWVTLA